MRGKPRGGPSPRLWRSPLPLQVTLIPQAVLRGYTPDAGSPLRDQIASFARDMLGMGLLVRLEVLPGLRVQVGSTRATGIFIGVDLLEGARRGAVANSAVGRDARAL